MNEKEFPPRIRQFTMAQYNRVREAFGGRELHEAASALPLGDEFLSMKEHEHLLADRERESHEYEQSKYSSLINSLKVKNAALTATVSRLKGLLGLALVELEAMDYGEEDEECEANLESMRQALASADAAKGTNEKQN